MKNAIIMMYLFLKNIHMSQETHINAAFGGLGYAERKAFKEKERPFDERIRMSEEKAPEIIDSSYMVEVAKEILRKHKEIDITNPNENEIAPLCHDYDPAVIVGICREINKRIKESH